MSVNLYPTRYRSEIMENLETLDSVSHLDLSSAYSKGKKVGMNTLRKQAIKSTIKEELCPF